MSMLVGKALKTYFSSNTNGIGKLFLKLNKVTCSLKIKMLLILIFTIIPLDTFTTKQQRHGMAAIPKKGWYKLFILKPFSDKFCELSLSLISVVFSNYQMKFTFIKNRRVKICLTIFRVGGGGLLKHCALKFGKYKFRQKN